MAASNPLHRDASASRQPSSHSLHGTSMLCDRHQRLRLLPSCRLCETFGQATDRCGWTQRTPPIWSHSPQCAECDHVGGRVWVGRVRN